MVFSRCIQQLFHLRQVERHRVAMGVRFHSTPTSISRTLRGVVHVESEMCEGLPARHVEVWDGGSHCSVKTQGDTSRMAK